MTAPLIPRQSPTTRSNRLYPLSHIEEGESLLLALASLRFATLSQLQRIIFNLSAVSARMARHRATRSLRRLFDAGYIERTSVFAPSATSGRLTRLLVHSLSARGAHAIGLDPRWARSRRPTRDQVLIHDYWLVEVAVLAMAGCPVPLSITTWWDDRVLAARRRQGRLNLPTIPDGLLIVRNEDSGKDFPSLVELDLGTETVTGRTASRRDVARKIEGYLEYLDDGFTRDFGVAAVPVVLIISESERRLASLRATTARLGGKGRFWFSTLQRLQDSDNGQPAIGSAGLQGPFWGLNWQTSLDDGWRSLATRCGV